MPPVVVPLVPDLCWTTPPEHPLVFAHLAQWLQILEGVARTGGGMEDAFARIPRGNPFFRADLLETALREQDAFAAVREAVAATREPDALLRRLHTWFDAFRTLKLIHALRDAAFPSMGWRQALTEHALRLRAAGFFDGRAARHVGHYSNYHSYSIKIRIIERPYDLESLMFGNSRPFPLCFR